MKKLHCYSYFIVNEEMQHFKLLRKLKVHLQHYPSLINKSSSILKVTYFPLNSDK